MSAQFARESAMLKLPELFLLSPIFHCHKIKDGAYNNNTNTNKVSPTQNTPALQANCIGDYNSNKPNDARESEIHMEMLTSVADCHNREDVGRQTVESTAKV